MRLVAVSNKEDIDQFLRFADQIYKNDPHWIKPLDKDIEGVFDPEKNKLFKRGGQVQRWLLKDKQEQTIGRIAAFVNPKYKEEQPTGGIGYFECIDNQEAANFMFDHCKAWLAERGMVAMDGPINFGEREKWWGLLIEGYYEPLYQMTYNPPYYKALFENYGFQIYFNQECFARQISLDFSPKLIERHAEVAQNKDFYVRHFKKGELEKFVSDFHVVYNDAWSVHGGGKELSLQQAKQIFKSMLPAIEENLVWFTYYKDRPVAFWLNLPDLNQYFKHFNGKFSWVEKLKFVWMKFTRKPIKRAVGLVFGVVKDYQGKGVDAFMIIEGTKQILKNTNYTEYEMQWIGDFNPKMINLAKTLDTKLTRRLATYRYHFDRTVPFKRHRMVGISKD